ncbi:MULTISPECIES: radical SAM protein [Desulfurella]|uniref:Wyosine [tRNA(Phe)-imidazoG37] synthetase, radical SAM superfamily n=1 Tax=Desulfurella multipotens TaxID=79269 RepID=A0A1G6QR66_9BACT|nr:MULTISPECIES: radical SAM protein [Desulfurella]AHF96840.1 radical SAM protein [Desulfurella acetivorans A63]HEX13911.1 radical SAM protein [Desulfurella acetivorans]PMP64093.1 MAG: radical SAM protein [Desulfurella multipotens]PMP92029.1 MAG: radical SAM protein [Desulfurella sp.]SDC94187.1 Wyosine [tRNA(Phe)-imidazoG37] synthetase, radical SAM superfamily [Desulfurella multipotens]
MEFLFGPVPSRRLGLSLGINIIPHKTCNYNCVYCEVGKTTNLTNKRQSFYNIEDIKKDFVEHVDKVGKFDFITFSGSGEPTLNKDLGELIKFVKSFNKAKIAVLTNGSLLYDQEVRRELYEADVVIPSLDAAIESTFKRINQPHKELNLKNIIEGLKLFTQEFSGEVWLEIVFAKGINDKKQDIEALIKAIEYIKPKKVQIGTIERPPAFNGIQKLSNDELMSIYMALKDYNVELIKPFADKNVNFDEFLEKSIIKMISIRPCSIEELSDVFDAKNEDVDNIVTRLINEKKAFKKTFGNKEFISARN